MVHFKGFSYKGFSSALYSFIQESQDQDFSAWARLPFWEVIQGSVCLATEQT